MAEFERGVIAERVKLGMARAKAQGKPVGRPRRAVTDIDLAAVAHLPVRQAALALGVSKSFVGEMAAVHKGGRNGRCNRAEFLGDSDLPMTPKRCPQPPPSGQRGIGHEQHSQTISPRPTCRDLLVEAFFAGDRDRVMALGRAIVAETVELGGTYGDEVATGVNAAVRPWNPRTPSDYLDLLDGVATEERIEALWDGVG